MPIISEKTQSSVRGRLIGLQKEGFKVFEDFLAGLSPVYPFLIVVTKLHVYLKYATLSPKPRRRLQAPANSPCTRSIILNTTKNGKFKPNKKAWA